MLVFRGVSSSEEFGYSIYFFLQINDIQLWVVCPSQDSSGKQRFIQSTNLNCNPGCHDCMLGGGDRSPKSNFNFARRTLGKSTLLPLRLSVDDSMPFLSCALPHGFTRPSKLASGMPPQTMSTVRVHSWMHFCSFDILFPPPKTNKEPQKTQKC